MDIKKFSAKNLFESTHPFSPVYPPLPMINVWSQFCRIEKFTSLFFSVCHQINKLFVNFDLKNSTFKKSFFLHLFISKDSNEKLDMDKLDNIYDNLRADKIEDTSKYTILFKLFAIKWYHDTDVISSGIS